MLTNLRISSWLGMPPPLGAASHLETISHLCKDSSIPKWYRARAEIHRQTVQLVNSVDSKLDFRTRHSLIKIFEQELDRVKDMYDDIWNDDLEMEWQGARLYLFGIAFISPGPNMNVFHGENPQVAAREVLQKGLAAAVGCLDTTSHMKLPQTQPGENRCDVPDHTYQLGFYPKHFFRIGAFATFYLLWFLAVDATASDGDKELARTYITFTYRLLLGFTHSPEHYRAGKGIEALAQMPIPVGKIASTRVHSRLGASFMYSYSLDGEVTNPEIPMLGVDTVAEGPAHPKLAHAESQTSPSAHTEHTPHSSPPAMHETHRQQSGHSSIHSQASPQMYQHPQPPQQHQHHQQHQQPQAPLQAPASFQPQVPTQPAHQTDPLAAPAGFSMPHAPGASMPAQMFTDGQMFDPAMLASMPSANFEYPWGEWDPSVFSDVPMDMNPAQFAGMNPADIQQMSINDPSSQRGYHQ